LELRLGKTRASKRFGSSLFHARNIADVLVPQSRRKEKRIPFEKVKANLTKNGKLRQVNRPTG
jgi:hypothetical protein